MTAVVVDTGCSARSLSRRRQSVASQYDQQLRGRQLVIAAQTVAELRYGAIVAGWGESRLTELERRIEIARIAIVDDEMIWTHARLRARCRASGHALAQPDHAADLWVAVAAVHYEIALVAHDTVFKDTPGLELVTEA